MRETRGQKSLAMAKRVPFPIAESLRLATLAALREGLRDFYTLKRCTSDPFALPLATKAIQSVEVAIDNIRD